MGCARKCGVCAQVWGVRACVRACVRMCGGDGGDGNCGGAGLVAYRQNKIRAPEHRVKFKDLVPFRVDRALHDLSEGTGWVATGQP